MIDLDDPVVREHVERKRRLRERASNASARASNAAREVAGAPNQRAVKNWIKLDLGRPVPATHDPWTRGDAFEIEFECESTARVARVTIGALKRANGGSWSDFDARDWHCVTGWSARGIDFKGVTLDVALKEAFPGMLSNPRGKNSPPFAFTSHRPSFRHSELTRLVYGQRLESAKSSSLFGKVIFSRFH